MPTIRFLLVILMVGAVGCSSDDTVQVSVSSVLENSGRGSVSAPNALQCEFAAGTSTGICQALLEREGSLEVTATPDEGSVFGGWTGDCTGTGTCTLALSGDRSVVVNFLRKDGITVTPAPGFVGSATVTSTPAGIACTLFPAASSGDCTAQFPTGSVVELHVTAGAYTVFDGWSGDCLGTICSLTLTGEQAIAVHTHGRYPLEVHPPSDNQGSGVITSAPAGINCTITAATTSGICATSFQGGIEVTLTATPAAGSSFAYWFETTDYGCAEQPTCPLNLSGSVNATARFNLLP